MTNSKKGNPRLEPGTSESTNHRAICDEGVNTFNYVRLSGLQRFLSGDGGTILCPHCGDQYVHLVTVEIFSRTHEDAEHGTHLTIPLNDPFAGSALPFGVDADIHSNPSSRRSGVVLHFQCEYECPDFSLSLAQNKGFTICDVQEGGL